MGPSPHGASAAADATTDASWEGWNTDDVAQAKESMLTRRITIKKDARSRNNKKQLTARQGDKKLEYGQKTLFQIARLQELCVRQARKVGAKPPSPPSSIPRHVGAGDGQGR